jgi:Family of unknown function (DUF6527)
MVHYGDFQTTTSLSSARIAARKTKLAVVLRGVPRWLVMQCPCGCGELLSINLDARGGKAWRLISAGKKISLIPSVWRTEGCETHFVFWLNTAYVMRPKDTADDQLVNAEFEKWVSEFIVQR